MLKAERNRVFGGWMEAHQAILFKVARAYGATHADREDLFQQIALQVWNSVEAFRGEAAVTISDHTMPPLLYLALQFVNANNDAAFKQPIRFLFLDT